MAEVDEAWFREYWSWVAVALFLLLSVDLLTTYFAAAKLGVAAEGNPVMAWAVRRGLATVLALNLGVVVMSGGMCWGLARMVERTPTPYRQRFARIVEAWLGLLLVVGLAVFANNLSAIVLGETLL